jgi:hypothetical protein
VWYKHYVICVHVHNYVCVSVRVPGGSTHVHLLMFCMRPCVVYTKHMMGWLGFIFLGVDGFV